ncbi:Proton pump-interactor 1 [Linum perenne]
MEVLEKAAPDRVFSRHRIQEAEEQIEIINQNLQEIVKKTEEKQVEIVLTRSTLNSLKSQDSTLRYQVVRRNEALDPLHLALDKLSFANSAYRDKSITNSCSPEEDIDYRIRRLHYRMIYYMSRKDEEENIKRQIKLLESEKERVIINCVVGGKLWRSFGSRKDIQNRINIAFDQNEVDNSVLPTAIDHLVVNGYVSIDDGNFSNFLDGLLWACRPKFIRLHCLNSSEILLEEFSSWYLLAKNSGKGDKEHCHRLKDAKIATEEEMKEEFRSFSKDMITLLNWGVWLRLTWY